MQDLRDLEVALSSSVPLITVETHEEPRVHALFKQHALRREVPLYRWSVTEGLRRVQREQAQFELVAKAGGGPGVAHEPTEALLAIKETLTPGIFLLSDFHPYLEDPVHIRLLKDMAMAYPTLGHHLVLISHKVPLPEELARYSIRFELALPERATVKEVVLEQAQLWSRRNRGRNVSTNRRMLERVVDNLCGLPLADVQRLARGAIEDDGILSEADLTDIMRVKYELLGQDGVLSFEYDTAQFAEVGGLGRLKEWLAIRESVFSGTTQRPGLDPPKGILLLGVQGCGKSLAAKAVAGAWGTPLLRLDFGTLYNKYHGETERNLREAFKQAEAMSPCVLWIDEIEKGIGVDTSDSGTSKRVLGSLLTWMAENKSRVFIVATANDIQSLPPELLRKGRLDEIFFVDLPDQATRKTIAGIHITKRELDLKRFDLDAIAKATAGFSGAEIEQAVVAALYATHAADQQMGTHSVLAEVQRTQPLSVVMAERLGQLRRWAAERTVPAQ